MFDAVPLPAVVYCAAFFTLALIWHTFNVIQSQALRARVAAPWVFLREDDDRDEKAGHSFAASHSGAPTQKEIDHWVRRFQRKGLPHADAKDCVQKLLLAYYQKPRPQSSVEAFLRAGFQFAIMTYWRHESTKKGRHEEEECLYEVADPSTGPEKLVQEADFLAKVREKLPPKLWAVLSRRAEDMRIDEIAAELRITPKTVYNRLRQAESIVRASGGFENLISCCSRSSFAFMAPPDTPSVPSKDDGRTETSR